MADLHDSQLLKGVLSILILRLLGERESYGYEIVQRLHDLGLEDVLEGTVYPALARLEREGRLRSRLVASRSGPARKYYRPTPDGYRALEDGTAGWQALADIVDRTLHAPLPAEPVLAEPTASEAPPGDAAMPSRSRTRPLRRKRGN